MPLNMFGINIHLIDVYAVECLQLIQVEDIQRHKHL
jgi:hypothetical protein